MDITADLRAAFEHWSEKGSWCARCKRRVTEGFCPQCRVVPPSPRGDLVRRLNELSAFGVDELLDLAGDFWSDVQNAALDGLIDLASRDAESLRRLIEEAASGTSRVNWLDRILSLPSNVLSSVAAEIIALSQADAPRVRHRIATAIPKVDVVPPEERVKILTRMLDDSMRSSQLDRLSLP